MWGIISDFTWKLAQVILLDGYEKHGASWNTAADSQPTSTNSPATPDEWGHSAKTKKSKTKQNKTESLTLKFTV